MKKLILLSLFALFAIIGKSQVFDYQIKGWQLQVDTSYTKGDLSEDVGTRYWDADDMTTSLVLPNGVILQDGQELFFDVLNQTGGVLADGKVASYAGAVGASGKIKAQYGIADYTVEEPNHMLGIITEAIPNGGSGKVTFVGKVRGIQTNGANYSETWVDGDVLYVSTTSYGGLTNVQPEAPFPAIPIAVVIKAHATLGTLLVRPTFPIRLEDLADVNGTPLTTSGQFPVWNNTENYFDFDKNINDYKLKSDSILLSGYFTQYDALSKEATLTKGTLTENIDGLVLSDSTRQVIGGATVLQVKSGRVIPTSTNISHGESGYSGRIATFTTTGSSGASTFSSNTLNIPNYTLSGLGLGGSKITYGSAFTFSNDRDIVDKAYVDAIAAGNMPKTPVEVATTGNITLSGTQTIDTYAAVVGNRVLVWNQTTPSQNGIYVVASGAWSRATDTDTWAELYKAYVVVINGSQSGSSFVCTIPSSGTLETTDVTWVIYGLPSNITVGTGLTKTGNEISLNVASASALGGIKIGAGIIMNGDTASVSTAYAPISIYPASGLTTGYLPYKTSTVLADSPMYTDGLTKVGIGILPDKTLDVNGEQLIRTTLFIGEPSTTTNNKNLYLQYNTTDNYSKIQSVHNNVSYTPLALQPSGGYLSIGTSTPISLAHLHSTSSTVLSLTDAGINQNWGGGIKGYGVADQGGYLQLGVINSTVFVPAITINPNTSVDLVSTINATGYKISGVSTFLNKFRTGYMGTSGQIPIANGVSSDLNWVTMSGDATINNTGTLTIANNAVTNAKAAQMATKTYKGRTSALTGNTEDVPVATLKIDLGLVKGDVGLGNVDNTSDANKPVSTATQTALNLKKDISDSTATTGYTRRDRLASQIATRVAKNASITGATKTKITYDAKGLVTSGADATTTDIAEGTNLYYTNARADARVVAGITGKQDVLNGTGFVKSTAGTISYDNSTYQPLATVLTNTTAPFTTAQETKLAGIATGATSNRIRANAYAWISDTVTFQQGDNISLSQLGKVITVSAPGIGTTTNAVTFNNSGTGDASGTTFNGSVAKTISYNSIGAAALAGSSSQSFSANGLTLAAGAVFGGSTNTTIFTSGNVMHFGQASGALNMTFDANTGTLYAPSITGGPGGTVTSVGLSAPTGFSISGSPVTTSGTLALSFATGYSLPTTTSQTNWDAAYSNIGKVAVQAQSSAILNNTEFVYQTGSPPLIYLVYEAPTSGGVKPVSSGGAYTALATKANLSGAAFTGAISSTSTMTATDFILSSDRRLKQGIRPLKNTNWTNKIQFVRYELKSDVSRDRYGVIAQDVEKFAPELVHTDKNGMKSVSYIDLLIAKVAELEKRIKELEDEK